MVPPLLILKATDPYPQPNIAERLRRRKLSANEKALEEFYGRNLPPGWQYTFNGQIMTLKRLAPVYVTEIPPEEFRILSNSAMIARAKSRGKKLDCTIEFHVERHDDIALIRQKVRLFKEIRADIEKAFERLRLRYLCRGWTPVECSLTQGPGRDAAIEFLTTRRILSEKLEVTPLYRIGTLYLYPQKNQCIPSAADWYFTNTQVPETARLLPFEAAEEIDLILRNMEQVRLWD